MQTRSAQARSRQAIAVRHVVAPDAGIFDPEASGPVQCVISPEALSGRIAVLEAPEGATIADVLKLAIDAGALPLAALPQTAVYVEGERLAREVALDRVLRAGEMVNLVVEPFGSDQGKQIAATVLKVVIMVVANVVGSFFGPVAGALISAAIMTLGSFAVDALFKPKEEKTRTDDRFALRGASNQYRPWGGMPLQLGKARIAPDFAVKTYTQTVGDDQWLYFILGIHYGACAVSNVKIGDTLISSMTSDEVQVAYHLTPGARTWSIYPNTVDQGDFTDELNNDGVTYTTRAGPDQGDTFEFDFVFPKGLWFNSSSGDVDPKSVTVTLEMRTTNAVGTPTGAWGAAPLPAAVNAAGAALPAGSFYVRAKSKEPYRAMASITVTQGYYEFRLKRDVGGGAKSYDQCVLSAIRAIIHDAPIADTNLAVIEMKVKATSLNQGTLAAITMDVEPICEVWNGSAWVTAVATSNPAAVTRWLVMGPAAAKPLTAGQVDASFGAWFTQCVTRDWLCGLRLEGDQTQTDAFRLLEQAGRASLYWNGRALVAAPWIEKPAPRQLFTGRNLRNHNFNIAYAEPVHALRVLFQNLEMDSKADELIVYADGYSAGTATKFETYSREGAMTMNRAWREGRFELARRRLQRRFDAWETDIENLACTYGDRVRLRGWRIRTRLGTARVRARRFSGALVSGLRLDQEIEMETGRTYGVDLRLEDQVVMGVPIVTVAGVTREITFATPRATNVTSVKGGMIAFGETGLVSNDVEVVAIEPAEGLSARILGVAYVAPELMAAEAGTVPTLTSVLTGGARPPTPVLQGVQADPTGIRVVFSQPLYSAGVIDRYICAWRNTPPAGYDGGWNNLPALPPSANTLVTPAVQAAPSTPGVTAQETRMDVRIIAATANGQFSTALTVTNILVRPSDNTAGGLTAPVWATAPTGVTRTAADGSAYGAIALAATAAPGGMVTELVTEFREWTGASPTGAWVAGPRLPAANPVGDIVPVKAGQKYGVKARWVDKNGWPSADVAEVTTTVPAGSTAPPTDWTPPGVEPSDPYLNLVATNPDIIVQ